MRLLLLLLLPFLLSAQSWTHLWSSGPNVLYRGRGTSYVQFRLSTTDINTYLYWTGFTGPSGVTAQFRCEYANNACWYNGVNYYQYVPSSQTGLKDYSLGLSLSASTSAPLGDHQITATLTSSQIGTPMVFTATVTIQDPPAPTSPPVVFPRVSIPSYSTWLSLAQTKGTQYCTLGEILYGSEAHVWYYDGGQAYQQMKKLLGESWKPCADWLIDGYRDHVNIDGESHGWHVFPHGLLQKYLETGQQGFKDAIYKLATNTPYLIGRSSSWMINFDGCWGGPDRETAYALSTLVAAEKAGYLRTDFMDTYENRPKLYSVADKNIFFLDNFFRTRDKRCEFQSWMAALGARALIEYYELTKNDAEGPDTRVIRIVKDLMDWVWANRDGSGYVLNNPSPSGGELCCSGSGGCQQYWGLNNSFLAPIFAWHWRTTGDPDSLTRGDTIFSSGVGVPIDTPKQFSQRYWYTFEYYRWRTEGLRGHRLRGNALKVKVR